MNSNNRSMVSATAAAAAAAAAPAPAAALAAGATAGAAPQPREQTFLRVKRRRNENPPSTIRLELLGGWNVRRQDHHHHENGDVDVNAEDSNNVEENGHLYPLRSSSTATLADSRHSAMSSTSTQSASNVTHNVAINGGGAAGGGGQRRTTTAAAVWKRVEELESGDDPLTAGENKRCRVVDAIIESDGRSTKRRKLTVLGEATSDEAIIHNNLENHQNNKKRKKNIYKVLDPTSRLVDDSLTMVHSGDRSIADHYQFLTTDPRLATNSRQWLIYQNRGGNLLHACAQWNDVEHTHDLLRQSLSGLVDATDEDGRTPYETAQMCSHDSVVEVLESFGADTTNYVYDLFVPEEIQVETTTTTTTTQQLSIEEEWNPLEKTAIDTTTSTAAAATTNATGAAAATDNNNSRAQLMDASRLLELQGGVGYYTEEGDLILEVEAHQMMGINNEFGHESDEDYDDEIDSNCEDYGGNDYPDEEDSWEEEFLQEEPRIEDDPYDDYGGNPTSDEYDMW